METVIGFTAIAVALLIGLGALGVGGRVEPQRRADRRRPVRLGPDRRVAVDDDRDRAGPRAHAR